MDEQRALVFDDGIARPITLYVSDDERYYTDPMAAEAKALDGALTCVDAGEDQIAGWGQDLDGPARLYITEAGIDVLVPMNVGLYTDIEA